MQASNIASIFSNSPNDTMNKLLPIQCLHFLTSYLVSLSYSYLKLFLAACVFEFYDVEKLPVPLSSPIKYQQTKKMTKEQRHQIWAHNLSPGFDPSWLCSILWLWQKFTTPATGNDKTANKKKKTTTKNCMTRMRKKERTNGETTLIAGFRNDPRLKIDGARTNKKKMKETGDIIQ